MTLSVNEVVIEPTAIAAEVQNHPAGDALAAERQAKEALVVRELLLQESARLGLVPKPLEIEPSRQETREDALCRQLLEQEVKVPDADAESCRRYYNNNQRRFHSADLYEAAHILFSASPDDQAAYDRAIELAERTIATLQCDANLFGDLARSESDCPSAEAGGNLGQVSRGDTLPEFETFLFNLEPGQLCPVPVKTRYGVHVVRLDRKLEGQMLPFEAVQEQIADYLHQSSYNRGLLQYIKILIGRAKIEGIELTQQDTPLVQ